MFFQIDDCEAFDIGISYTDFTIFCYIDSNECNPCIMERLFVWSHFKDELKKLKTGVVFIVESSNEDVVRATMERLRLDFPVVFDKESVVKHKNTVILDQHSVFAVNNRKEVVWLGLPIESADSWNRFRKTLRQKSKRFFF
jgi:hypothetical protein